jgi:hypothetical protein
MSDPMVAACRCRSWWYSLRPYACWRSWHLCSASLRRIVEYSAIPNTSRMPSASANGRYYTRDHINNMPNYIYIMIWYDMIPMIPMIWYDMIWYDMIWYETIWYETIWYDMIWDDMIRYDTIWYDMIWYDMIWYERSEWWWWVVSGEWWVLNDKCWGKDGQRFSESSGDILLGLIGLGLVVMVSGEWWVVISGEWWVVNGEYIYSTLQSRLNCQVSTVFICKPGTVRALLSNSSISSWLTSSLRLYIIWSHWIQC